MAQGWDPKDELEAEARMYANHARRVDAMRCDCGHTSGEHHTPSGYCDVCECSGYWHDTATDTELEDSPDETDRYYEETRP